jgi:hypothetical protein
MGWTIAALSSSLVLRIVWILSILLFVGMYMYPLSLLSLFSPSSLPLPPLFSLFSLSPLSPLFSLSSLFSLLSLLSLLSSLFFVFSVLSFSSLMLIYSSGQAVSIVNFSSPYQVEKRESIYSSLPHLHFLFHFPLPYSFSFYLFLTTKKKKKGKYSTFTPARGIHPWHPSW